MHSKSFNQQTKMEQVIITKEHTAEFPVAAPGLYEVMVRPRARTCAKLDGSVNWSGALTESTFR